MLPKRRQPFPHARSSMTQNKNGHKVTVQSDSKLLSGFLWHINGNINNNLESPM
jgi:hypothetical protein